MLFCSKKLILHQGYITQENGKLPKSVKNNLTQSYFTQGNIACDTLYQKFAYPP